MRLSPSRSIERHWKRKKAKTLHDFFQRYFADWTGGPVRVSQDDCWPWKPREAFWWGYLLPTTDHQDGKQYLLLKANCFPFQANHPRISRPDGDWKIINMLIVCHSFLWRKTIATLIYIHYIKFDCIFCKLLEDISWFLALKQQKRRKEMPRR